MLGPTNNFENNATVAGGRVRRGPVRARGSAAAVLAGAAFSLGAPVLLADDGIFPEPAARAGLRTLSTDRPDKTETPFTVDPGHLQVEMDLFRYVHDREVSGGRERTTEEWAIGPVLVKLGVLDCLDLELGLEPYRAVRTEELEGGSAVETHQEGFGSLAVRGKLNLWGNDGGPTALGLLPFLVLPTSQDGLGANTPEGGVLLPFYLELPQDFELGMGTGAVWLQDDSGTGHHPELVNSVTLGRTFGKRVSAYVEFWTLLDPDRPEGWQGTFDFGVNLWLGPDLKFDAGLNLGVTDAAPDWNPFVGVSWRH